MRAPYLIGLLCALLALPAKAEQQQYELRLAGLRLGSLIYVANTTPTAYATRILFETSGLAGLLTPVRFEAQASGRGSGRDLSPQWAQETTRRDGSTDLTEIRWTGLRPRITREEPPEPDQLDPGLAPDSVDLATGLHAMFRTTDAATACELSLRTYDGKRLLGIEIGTRVLTETGFTCDGAAARLAGVAPEGMIDPLSGGFTLQYERLGDDLFQLTRVDLRTSLGTAQFRLRDVRK